MYHSSPITSSLFLHLHFSNPYACWISTIRKLNTPTFKGNSQLAPHLSLLLTRPGAPGPWETIAALASPPLCCRSPGVSLVLQVPPPHATISLRTPTVPCPGAGGPMASLDSGLTFPLDLEPASHFWTVPCKAVLKIQWDYGCEAT